MESTYTEVKYLRSVKADKDELILLRSQVIALQDNWEDEPDDDEEYEEDEIDDYTDTDVWCSENDTDYERE